MQGDQELPTTEALEGVFARDFRLIFEASPDVLLVLLPDAPRFTMVAATDARLAATHMTREETIGRALFEAFPDNPDTPEATGMSNLKASLERVLATRAPDTMAVQRYDIRGTDGTFQTKHWSPKNIPVLSSAGEVLYILHRVEDVTDLIEAVERGDELRDQTREMEREVVKRSQELAEANAELRHANDKLGQLDEAKTAFFSNVSHEFRTPLTLLLAPVEDALQREDEALQGESLRSVHRNSLRLLRLVNSLLDFARLEAGRLQASFEPTDLAKLTAGVAGSFYSLFDSAGLELVVECPDLSSPAYVDPSQWEKVVSNLVSNAFKFTMDGTIRVSVADNDGRFVLAVSDTGVGIPEHEVDRVFERFHRIEGTPGRSFEGTGIGLALVKDLVELHGGSVRVDSEVGRGTTFTVSIPTGSAHLPQDRIVEPGHGTGGVGAASLVLEAARWSEDGTELEGLAPAQAESEPRQRILVVDDNVDMRRYLTSVLGPYWSVETAANGEDALAKIRELLPDLVVSDVMMPRMDGFALLRELRASPATRAVPVLLLSARAGEEALVEGLETGADGYLLKPFSTRELLTRVRAHLDQAQARSTALRASESRFRALAESGIVGITVSDADGRILESNAAFLDMIGRSHDELLQGKLVWELFGQAGGRRVVPSAGRAYEGEYQLGNGRRLPVLVAVAPLDNDERIAVSLDLSAQKKLADQFRQAQKMEAVGRLAGGIAHDFNNVLSVVLSYADLICQELDPDDPLRSDALDIRQAAERATELTRQLLSFSRQQVLQPKVLSLNRIVVGMEKMLHRLLGADVELTLLSEPRLWNIEADPGQLEQVLMNLAVNARDAMPEGGRLTIETHNVVLEEEYVATHHEVAPGSYVMLAVSDTGTGMDATTRARVFEPFFTTKEQGKGTGLGLATVFGIVKQSRGHIWIYTEPGQGTTFKVYFPRVEGEAEVSASEQPPPLSFRGHETILLVEDDPQVRGLAQKILRRSGYVVLDAPNGGEALLICEQYDAKIDLLLTDVVLPRMSGRQLAERLQPMRPEIKVLFMSGYTDDAILQHGVLDSGVAYLQKPLTPTTLTRKIREVLETTPA